MKSNFNINSQKEKKNKLFRSNSIYENIINKKSKYKE